MKVLLIEDEPKMARTLKTGLEEEQITVDCAPDGEAGRQLAFSNSYHVIVSDVVMPGLNGVELLRQLRSSGNFTPVLLLTALGQTDDKIAGFEAGADDYLTKPFEFRELLLRIKALARRNPQEQPDNPENFLYFADLQLDLNTREVLRGGQRIALTPREFDLMEYFLRNAGRVISKTEISEKVWNLNFDTGTNIVEVYVNFLRKKIDKNFENKLIHTHFRNGYILRLDESDKDAR